MSKEEGIKIDIESADDDLKDEKTPAPDAEDEAEKINEETENASEDTPEEDNAPEEDRNTGSEEAGQPEEAGEKSEDEPEGSKEKKKHFGKKNKKDPRDEKIEQLEDRVKRQMAEFENFRKRTDKEKSGMYDMGAKSVIEKILPVIDNFERGLDNIPEGSDSAFVDGMQMIYKQLATELDKLGVKPIEAVGKPFDPTYHNAVMQVESEEYESGVVAQELQKGYMYHETVVRPSMVGVVP